MSTLADAAKIRAALMNLELPSQFVSDWLLWRTLQPVEWTPKELPLPISATRDFWLATFKAKVETMIKNEGDIIGWPEDNETHDDFGIHNMLNLVTESGQTSITSLFDWETGCVVPVVLSKIVFFIAGGDLTIDENGEPSVYIRPGWSPKPEELAKNQGYSAEFLKEINRHAPYLEEAIHKAKDAHHLWVKLKKWKGQDPEKFFGELGDWAEK
ncbi:hypothetical protein LCI18_013313 [Fusarium solani-melongenae]|uniref:Uncharacterized protein n=1 Tax=Fusarium solani subsp. cucurbitae TaxID=2747967 RepID=A0ACD3ZQK3_FUSSC|nr:hypothetical protein LCI18_013313 [Fusarium solani-melongenae]